MIVGFAGRKGHGKDSAAAALDGFMVVKFADGLKGMIRSFMLHAGMDEADVEACVDRGTEQAKGLSLAHARGPSRHW